MSKILSSDIMEALNDAERCLPVAAWRLDDVPLWPLLRMRFYFDAIGRGFGGTEPPRDRLSRPVARVQQAFADWWRYRRACSVDPQGQEEPSAPADAVFLSDGISMSDIAGKWFDRFCDPLAEMCSDMGLTTQRLTASRDYRVPRTTRSVFVQPSLDREQLLAMIRRRVSPSPVVEADGYDDFLELITRRGFSTSALELPLLVADAVRVKASSEWFRNQLGQVNPRVAFLVSYYNVAGMGFVHACRTMGIPSIDIQHGVQGPLHVAYGRWHAVPRIGYTLLPDMFWVWSDVEAAAIRAWQTGATERHAPVVGGNPWMDAWMTGDVPAFRRAEDEVKQLVDPSRRRVLVTLQFGFDDAVFLDPLLSVVAHAPENQQWWVRLHPMMAHRRSEIVERFEAAFPQRVLVGRVSDVPLGALLRYVDAHVTHSSSTVIEAAQFGCRSIVTSDYGAELFPDQLASGEASICDLRDPGFYRQLDTAMSGKSPPVAATAFAASVLARLMETGEGKAL